MCSDKSTQSADDDSDILHSNNNNNTVYKPLENPLRKRKNENRKRILAQTLVTGAVMLSSASCGMPVGYSAILLPQLKMDNGSMMADDEVGSWIASIHSAATPVGSLISGLLMDRFGRKMVLQYASTPLILGWLLIAFSDTHALLLAGRMVAGISAGLTAAAGQVLIGEISEPHLRGMFSSVPFASYSFGILLVYALGSFLEWRYVAGLSIILPLASLAAFCCLPESPVWLIRNAQVDKAKKAMLWLRGGNRIQAKEETDHLILRLETESANNKKLALTSLFRSEVIKPLIIINMFNTLQILSGTYLIVFYAVDILKYVQGGETFDHFLTAVLTAGVRFIFSIFASMLLALIGRRSLAMISGIGSSVSTVWLAIILHQSCNTASYVPALLILIYVATNTMGFMILPGVMLGELFPAKIRGIAGGITFMVFNLVLFGVAKIFPFVKNLVNVSGVFWIFGVSSIVACLFLYLTLPETKSKSLSEIEDYFQQRGFLWVSRDKRWERKNDRNETEQLNV